MARPLKSGLDYFPLWKPQRITEQRFYSSDFMTRYKALRNSSNAFIRRKDVRNYILSKNNNQCVICGETKNLEVDHKASVYLCAKGLIDIDHLNVKENLTVLCKKCNAGRCPNAKA